MSTREYSLAICLEQRHFYTHRLNLKICIYLFMAYLIETDTINIDDLTPLPRRAYTVYITLNGFKTLNSEYNKMSIHTYNTHDQTAV